MTAPSGIFERFRVEPRERFSSYSHAAGALAALVGGVVLWAVVPMTPGWRWVVVVYAFGSVAMFGASALYHAQKREEGGTGFWRRVDHSAVFLMIAGTYTPVCFAYLSGAWFWGVLGAQWALAIVGILFKLTALGNRRRLTVSVYLAMGWMAAIPIVELLETMPLSQLGLLGLGGVFYTGGAVVYALKKPDPWSDHLGFHGLFHIAIIGAAVMHYILVYRSAV